MTGDVTAIPTIPEGRLGPADAAALPPAVAAAPWDSAIEGVLWWHRAAPGARELLPPALAARAGLSITIGGLIHYRQGPVGPYAEVFGSPVMLRGGLSLAHVAFMAVDSAASVAGGRRNWALPKVAARFASDPAARGRVLARGRDWELALAIRARPRPLPAWCAFTCAQVWPDGAVRSFRVLMRGSARLGSVHVGHLRGSGLQSWLLPGRHPALLLAGTQHVSPPRED